MIQIKEFEITNYRSCVKTKVETSSSLTSIIGANGVGKSNILNGLLLLQRGSRGRYIDRLAINDSASNSTLNILLQFNNDTFNLKADIYYETDETNHDEIYATNLKFRKVDSSKRRPKEIEPIYFEIAERMKFGGRSTFRSYYDRYINTENNKLKFDLVSFFLNISYYSATQFADPTKCPISIEVEDSRIRSPRNKVHDKFIFDLYTSYKSGGKAFKRYLDIVNKNGIGLIDDIKFFDHSMPSSSYKVKSGGKIQKIERTKNIIIPLITLDNLSLSPNQLSEGTFKTLALVFYILHDESDLLLIEEPEVCVHHGLLASIIELIKIQSKFKQIIISTHSDYVLDMLEPENIVLVKKDLAKGTIAKSLTKTLSKNDYKALKEYLSDSGNLGEYWKEGGFENE